MDEENDIIEDNHPQTILQVKGLTPRIFDSNELTVPEGFNTVIIRMDGRINSDLDWKGAAVQAAKAIENGLAILWEINLGLFDQLKLPLESQTQFLSLTLSLEHFRDTLWKEFSYHSIGLILYRGSADFSQFFQDDSDQLGHFEEWLNEHFSTKYKNRSELAAFFFRDVAVEYLSLLAMRLPEFIPAYLALDASSLTIERQLQLLNPDRFDLFQLIIKGSELPFKVVGDEIKVGVCLPLMDCYDPDQWRGIEEAIRQLREKSIPYKLISESRLITRWEGLDYLIFAPEGLSSQGKRKLQGFCAAGGTVVSVSTLLGLPHELLINDWLMTFKTN